MKAEIVDEVLTMLSDTVMNEIQIKVQREREREFSNVQQKQLQRERRRINNSANN